MKLFDLLRPWAGLVENELTPKELLGLSQLSSSNDLLSLDTETSKRLVACVSRGVGFHHAGMSSRQKSSVEKLFRELKLKAVCSTPTLSQGVNLPARRVIIQGIKRFDTKFGWVTVSAIGVREPGRKGWAAEIR